MSEHTFYICIDCSENEEIDGFRCFDCKYKYELSEIDDSELTLEWIN